MRKASVLFALLVIIFSTEAIIQVSKAWAKQRRTALIIGNANYESAPLKNPVNDARDIADTLKNLGFSVTLKTDANQRSMERAIRDFGNDLRRGGVGLFYFAGHGVQVRGNNYLVPIAADIESEGDVKYETVDAGLVLAKMEDAANGLNIIILDACRNNPFSRSFRSAERGLARMDAPTGSILAFSTAPGSVAADGTGRNGLYTSVLLKHIDTTGIDLPHLFMRVRKDVVKETNRKQVPWESSSLIGDFYFSQQRGVAVTSKPNKSNIAPPKNKKVEPQKQVIASIAPAEAQTKIILRKEAKKSLSEYSLKNMIHQYNFYERSINRSGRFENNFVDNKDGTITDLATGLMWQKGGSIKNLSKPSANRHLKNLNKNKYAGYSDWRLPTVEELVSILQSDRSKEGMYLNSKFDNAQKRCWTKDGYPIEGEDGYNYEGKWVVDFESGYLKKAQFLRPGTAAGRYASVQKDRRIYNYVKAVRTIK